MGTENLSIANMSDDEWDADGFEPKGVPTDKWDGEDEDDDIKDAWDKSDSEEDKSKGSNSEETKIYGLVPVTKEDFEQFGKAISEKIQMFSTSEHYSDLIENITKEICVDLNTASLKKVKLNIESLHSAKLKEEKALKSGKKSVKGKSVKMDLDKDLYGGSIGDGFDDMDDFM